jgi:hypothetical protein
LHLCRRVTPKTLVGGDISAIKYLLVVVPHVALRLPLIERA